MFEDFKESDSLSKPFTKEGSPEIWTSIVAILFTKSPLSREAILSKISNKHTGKSRGYLSNHFSELNKYKVIRFFKRDRTWLKGENFFRYLNYIFLCLLEVDKKVQDNLIYRMLPIKEGQALDFISQPDEDIFNKPNPFID